MFVQLTVKNTAPILGHPAREARYALHTWENSEGQGNSWSIAAPKHPQKEPCTPAAPRLAVGWSPRSSRRSHTHQGSEQPGACGTQLHTDDAVDGETRGHGLPVHQGSNAKDGCKITQGFESPKSSSTAEVRCNSSL